MALREHRFDETDELLFLYDSPEELAQEIQKFQPGEFYKRTFSARTIPEEMHRYLDKLREAGIDIGKGEATFGYHMYPPKKEDRFRELIIYRRK